MVEGEGFTETTGSIARAAKVDTAAIRDDNHWISQARNEREKYERIAEVSRRRLPAIYG